MAQAPIPPERPPIGEAWPAGPTAGAAESTAGHDESGREAAPGESGRPEPGRRPQSQRGEPAEESSHEPPGPAAGTRLSAREIHDNVSESGEEEMRRPPGQLFWSSLAAGLTIGFSVLAAAFLFTLAPPGLEHAAAAAGYPLGFILVVLARSQLFTENTLDPVIPLLHNRDRATLVRLLRLWVVVLAGNLVGTFVFALVAARTSMLDAGLHAAVLRLSVQGTEGGFWLVAFRAIFGGWLVALMAWLVSSTRSTGAQLTLIWLTTAPIAAFGFRHSIAGAVEAFFRVGVGQATWPQMTGQFLVPAIIGNIVGGVTLVALLNHGQVGGAPRRWRF